MEEEPKWKSDLLEAPLKLSRFDGLGQPGG